MAKQHTHQKGKLAVEAPLPQHLPKSNESEEGKTDLQWLESYVNGEISEEEAEKLDEKLAEQECNVCYAAQFDRQAGEDALQ